MSDKETIMKQDTDLYLLALNNEKLEEENKELKAEIQELNDSVIWWKNRYEAQENINKEHQKINGELQQENKQLKEQVEYIRSGEYYNQLRFERDMLQDLVDKGKISKEDKEFIDCTHRNTELLEIIDKIYDKILNYTTLNPMRIRQELLNDLKGDSNE